MRAGRAVWSDVTIPPLPIHLRASSVPPQQQHKQCCAGMLRRAQLTSGRMLAGCIMAHLHVAWQAAARRRGAKSMFRADRTDTFWATSVL